MKTRDTEKDINFISKFKVCRGPHQMSSRPASLRPLRKGLNSTHFDYIIDFSKNKNLESKQ